MLDHARQNQLSCGGVRSGQIPGLTGIYSGLVQVLHDSKVVKYSNKVG